MFETEAVRAIFDKYEIPRILWYVDYPEKPHWNQPFGVADLEAGLVDFYSQPAALLYAHMPYCPAQCLFCNCKTIISGNYSLVHDYLDWLYKEIKMHDDFCKIIGLKPNITEMHLGGGSPTYINKEDFKVYIEKLGTLVNIDNAQEISMEIDPRHSKPSDLIFYRSMGVNRISFGIQDFDEQVQESINRIQPAFLIERLLNSEVRSIFPNGINFDIMGGLPYQTRDSFRETIEKVVELSPDRISLLQMSLVPKHSPHQLLMPLDKVPNNYGMKLLFIDALKILTQNGYVRTGYDHFAKPGDSVVVAREENKMTWGYYGSSPGRYTDVLGIGMSAYSQLGDHYYSQSFYELDSWQQAISKNEFPLYRGHKLNIDDIIRRTVIQTLRNYFVIKYEEIEKRYGINFRGYFAAELNILEQFAEDGLAELKQDSLELTDLGQLFADFIASKFDAYSNMGLLPNRLL